MMRRNERGQALVELAIILPVFLALLIGVFDVGRAVWVNNTLATGAREAARFAIVHGGSGIPTCPVGPAGPDAMVPNASEECPHPSPSKQAIKDTAERWISGIGSVTISVCYGEVDSCVGDADEPGATNARGTPITVTVSTDVALVAPSLLGLGDIHLAASSTMTVHN